MTFTKASILGFSAGFVAAIVVGRIRVPRPAFLISVDKKEHLSKKEAAAKINDALEDRELLFEILLAPETAPAELFERVKLKALIDPQWAQLVELIKGDMRKDQ